jgi:hypothetical protein
MQYFFQISFSRKLVYIVVLLLCSQCVFAQLKGDTISAAVLPKDTTHPVKKTEKLTLEDSTKKRARAAAIRSAILPGLGQIYNKSYWKLPIVYGALGVTGYIFFDNLKTYREYRFAYSARFKAAKLGATAADSVDYNKLKPEYKIYQPESIRSARDRFRKYIDYSALFFIVFWGLNVVDATVDAHLRGFDVSPDLSFRIKPGHSEMAGTNGLSLVLAVKDKRTYPKLPTFK